MRCLECQGYSPRAIIWASTYVNTHKNMSVCLSLFLSIQTYNVRADTHIFIYIYMHTQTGVFLWTLRRGVGLTQVPILLDLAAKMSVTIQDLILVAGSYGRGWFWISLNRDLL